MFVNAGKVYVFQSEDGPVKVGCSKDVRVREHTIQTSSGRKITNVWHTEDCSNYNFVEKQAHKLLKNYRTIGEWFDCDFNTAKAAVSNVFKKFAEFNFQTNEEAERQAKETAEYFAKKFLPELFYNEQVPSEMLDLERWVPSENDKGIVMQFLMDAYVGTLECADEESAQEYIDLYRQVENDGICSCKDEIQGIVCEYFWAVDGKIETFYKGCTNILEVMSLTIIKEPMSA